MADSYVKLNDPTNAIRFYNKSLSEHHSADVLNKLREVEEQKAVTEKEAYRNPQPSDEAGEKGKDGVGEVHGGARAGLPPRPLKIGSSEESGSVDLPVERVRKENTPEEERVS